MLWFCDKTTTIFFYLSGMAITWIPLASLVNDTSINMKTSNFKHKDFENRKAQSSLSQNTKICLITWIHSLCCWNSSCMNLGFMIKHFKGYKNWNFSLTLPFFLVLFKENISNISLWYLPYFILIFQSRVFQSCTYLYHTPWSIPYHTIGTVFFTSYANFLDFFVMIE